MEKDILCVRKWEKLNYHFGIFMEKFYITTSIMYANSKPHVGFAMELFQADSIARLQRLFAKDVFFLTGSDENGLKNFRTAQNNNKTPQEFVDENTQSIKLFTETHQVSINDFIRTTDQKRHWPTAQKIWSTLEKKDLLKKKKYGGWYCAGCESFIKEDDLNEKGECATHLKKPEWIEEENYFFELSSFSEQILEKIDTKELVILPTSREHEIKNVLKEGLQDISFSRPKSSLSWGIPLPNNPEQVMYVWCDALTNYISALGYADNDELFQKYWPADIHLIGKDIIRFHAAIWPAILLAADLPLPKIIFTHGFILSGGQKMSKSLGNVIDPVELSDKYGVSALRLLLLKEIPAFADGDLTIERIGELYHSELANKLGNLISRSIAMAKKYFEAGLPEKKYDLEIEAPIPDIEQFNYHSENFGRTDVLLEKVWKIIEATNRYIDDQKPWELAKNDQKEDLNKVIYNLLEMIRIIALLLEIAAPEVSSKIMTALGQKYFDSSINNSNSDYSAQLAWGQFDTKSKITNIEPLFPRIE